MSYLFSHLPITSNLLRVLVQSSTVAKIDIRRGRRARGVA